MARGRGGSTGTALALPTAEAPAAEGLPPEVANNPGLLEQILNRNAFIPFLDNPLTRGTAQVFDAIGGTLGRTLLSAPAAIIEGKVEAAEEGLLPEQQLTKAQRQELWALASNAGMSPARFEAMVDGFGGDFNLMLDFLERTTRANEHVDELNQIEQAELARLAGLRERLSGALKDEGRLRTDDEYADTLAGAEDTFRAFAENARMQSRQMSAARTGGALTGRQLQHERAVDRDLSRGLESARSTIRGDIRRRLDDVERGIPEFRRSVGEERRNIQSGLPTPGEITQDWRDRRLLNYGVRDDLAAQAIEGGLAVADVLNPMNAVTGARYAMETGRDAYQLGKGMGLLKGR